ncbi:hypothetical protein [Actinomadura miaoliensis]|uniref:hypothetical protein n=1 Tax=Actinomadura miaoliensis TaxID=430685 RepID=UPI0031E73AD7
MTWRRAQMVLLSAQGMPVGKIAKSEPAEHGLPFSTWSLAKPADFLAAEGVVDDISHQGLRVLLREEGVSFQRIKTWKTSRDPDYATKKARVEHLYAIADGEVMPEEGEPEVVFCLDEFGPLNLQPHPGRQWAERGGRHKDPGCNSSWLNRIEAQFTALRYFTLDGTDHATRKEEGSMIRRYIIWRNQHAADERLRERSWPGPTSPESGWS